MDNGTWIGGIMVKSRVKGSYSLPKRWNKDTGEWEKYEGHDGHSGLVTIHTALTSAVATLFTVTTGKRGYITFLHVSSGHTATSANGKKFAFKTTGTAGSTYLVGYLTTHGQTNDRMTLGNGGNPIMELAAGVFRGNMETAASHWVTISYYEA